MKLCGIITILRQEENNFLRIKMELSSLKTFIMIQANLFIHFHEGDFFLKILKFGK